jgi:predicted metal-binding membrane protein
MAAKMPPLIGHFVFSMLQSHIRKQLYARGIASHAPEIIEAKGRADIDALAAFLGATMWAVMMVGMMLPSPLPMIFLFTAVQRRIMLFNYRAS